MIAFTSKSERSAHRSRAARHYRATTTIGALILSGALVMSGALFATEASAATAPALGSASTFAVLAATAVTDGGGSTIAGDVGLSSGPGTGITGLTQAQVTGHIDTTDGTGPAGEVQNAALLTSAQDDVTTAVGDATGQTATPLPGATGQLNGGILAAGAYSFGAGTNLTGSLTLDGGGDANAVFIFDASSTLITAASSTVTLENGAQACNVFWVVGSSATLGASSTFVGSILAADSASLGASVNVQGQILAQTGAVTLIGDTIDLPTCSTGPVGGSAGTPVTFTVSGGSLSISAPSSTVSLGTKTVSSLATTFTGSLGLITVSDQRGGTTTWTASVTSTSFAPASGPADPSSNVSYAPGVVTDSANVAATGEDASDLSGAASVVTGASTGPSTASWSPTLSVVVPGSFAPGVYAATITNSVA